MAINVRIIEKIESKSSGKEGMKDNLLSVLTTVEADRQPKRVITKLMSNIK